MANPVKICGLLLAGLMISCNGTETDTIYKERMREFVQGISSYAKQQHSSFIIIPQNGHELVTASGESDDTIPAYEYLAAIDGAGQEDLFYGYSRDDKATAESKSEYLLSFLVICENNSVEVLVSDYCSSHDNMNESYVRNKSKGFISFAAPDRELSIIPDYPPSVYNENDDSIQDLSEAKNFLYIINPENYATADDFVTAVAATNYDLVIMDFFFGDVTYTSSQLQALKKKANGGKRLLISYMSIGEAEDYRYYWDEAWSDDEPDWIEEENPRWEGNYKVKYWDPEWQSLIYGSNDAYLDRIIDAGFDGVYLDIIDAFEYFE